RAAAFTRAWSSSRSARIKRDDFRASTGVCEFRMRLYYISRMQSPPTKPPKCDFCEQAVADLAAWGIHPTPRDAKRTPAGASGGRPRTEIGAAFYQGTFFMVAWLDHLRGVPDPDVARYREAARDRGITVQEHSCKPGTAAVE